ncbi:GAF domain-containing protein [Candidatus Magnetominusculus dajiuhuensis]|uniref:GAF domain-containing protein n=1 Tax=Candidatus Magnetominusculus dajiuhuensis TaxID=3137712 RepID=UPI003B42B745
MRKSLLDTLSSSIRAKMSLFISLLIFVVMGSLFIFTDLTGVPFTDIESDYEEYFDGAVANLNQIADTRKDNINKKILSLTSNIETFVDSSLTKSYVSDDVALAGNKEFIQYLEDYRRTYNIFDNIQMADIESGKIIAATRTIDIGRDVSYEYYVTGAIKTPCYHICFAFDRADGDTDLYISHVINVDSKPRYVIIMNVSAADIFAAINSNSQRGDNTETVLADNDGRLLVELKHPLPDGSKAVPLQYRVDAPIMAHALKANEGTIVGNDYRGAKVLAAYRYIPIDADAGWALVVKRDYSDVLAPYYHKLRYVIVLILCYIVAALIVTNIIIRWLTGPILILKKAACEIGKGRLDTVVEVKTKDELGQLARTFNNMVKDLRELEETRRINEKRLEYMVQINQLSDKPLSEIMDFVLEKSIELANSSIGFIAFGNEDETEFTKSAFSKNVMNECVVRKDVLRFSVEHFGLWGEALRQRGPVIVNSYETTTLNKKGYPQGHVPLKNMLFVPTFDGDRIVLVTAVGNKDGQYTQTDVNQLTILMDGLWQNIERKRLTDELRRLNDELMEKVIEETQKRQRGEQLLTQQSKMAAMGEMISLIAHQWKQPLNVIAVTAQDLNDAYSYGELNAEYLTNTQETIVKHVEFMVNTVDDFRKFLRPSKEKVQFDVKKAIEELVGLFSAYFVKDNCVINITSDEGGFSYNATGYPNEFKQVILNIINNARDAILSRREGKLSADRDNIDIHISHADGGNMIITISDTGGGIPEDIIGRVFDAHFTTKASNIGTGIGLYMSKTIIETNMGWSLTVRNIEGGAEFKIEI